MPNKLDTIKYTEAQDGRVKILKSQYPEVVAKYKAMGSMRAVAGYYGVNKRLIQFIVYPERLEKLKEHNKQIRHWKKYYSTEGRKLEMRKFRERKKLILNNNQNDKDSK